MAQWGNTDDAANSVIWGVAGYRKEANTSNQSDFFGNTTADAFITGLTVGQFGVDRDEMAVARESADPRGAHAGWNVRKDLGNGRVMFETLVAMRNITGDASDDTTLPDFAVRITSQPSNATGDISNNDIVTFTVGATTVPSGGTVTYVWQKWGGATFANLTNTGAYSNTTTDTLSVLANTASNGEIYRARMTTSAGSAEAVFTSNAVLTLVA